MPKSFTPIIDDRAKMLILGTLPSVISLEKGEYYANPQNQFWNIIFSVFDEILTTDYNDKCRFLKKHRIALWDIVEHAERDGSLDTAIKHETPNDIRELLHKHPNISLILLNGTKAMHLWRKYFKDIEIKHILMPSTSPAYTITLEKKKKLWESALCHNETKR